MDTVNIRDLAPIPGAESYGARSLKETELFGMTYFSLPPGGLIPMHNMPFEVCFVVLSGKGTLTIDDEPFNVGEGSRAVCRPMTRRGWRNYGTLDNLEVLVIKIKKDRETQLPGPLVGSIFDSEPAKNPHGVDVRRVYEGEHALSSMITLKPGESLLKHITPVDAFFFVVSGRGVVEIGDENDTFGPGTFIESPRDIPHCWYNRGHTDLRFLVLKVPKPTLPTRFPQE